MARISQPSRRVELSTFLLCLCLSMIMLFLPDDVQISVATRLGAVIIEPYMRVINFAEDVFRVRRENGRLQGRVAELELELAALARNRAGSNTVSETLRSVSQFQDRLIPCEVVTRKRGRYALMIQVKSDSALFWQLYQPVMSPRGLVGRIRKIVSPHTAWVELLSAPDVAIGCELERTGLLGILRSSAGAFILDMVGRDEDVRIGDRIITSGIAEVREIGQEDGGLSLMPRGLPVGEVSSVSSPLHELFKNITVAPFASFNVNEWVFVVQGKTVPAKQGGTRP